MTETRARALLTRLGTFLDQFTTCFSRRAHRTYASRYLQGLLNKQIMARHSISEGTFHRNRRQAILTLARELENQERIRSSS